MTEWQEDEFDEDKETVEAICEFYNECEYTPENVTTEVERLPNGDFVPQSWCATKKVIYWSNDQQQWKPWPI